MVNSNLRYAFYVCNVISSYFASPTLSLGLSFSPLSLSFSPLSLSFPLSLSHFLILRISGSLRLCMCLSLILFYSLSICILLFLSLSTPPPLFCLILFALLVSVDLSILPFFLSSRLVSSLSLSLYIYIYIYIYIYLMYRPTYIILSRALLEHCELHLYKAKRENINIFPLLCNFISAIKIL